MRLVTLVFQNDEIGKCFSNFYKTLFLSSYNPDNLPFSDNLNNLFPSIITSENNTDICTIPSPKDIKNVLFSFASNKSPGPDGLPPLFYKSYWKTTGKALTEAVQHFFKTSHLLKALNHTLIALIPTISHPYEVEQFRPISLCNVTYRVISKLIANKLKTLSLSNNFPISNGFC